MSGSKRTHQTRAGMSAGSKEKERKASAERRKRHVSRVCAEAGPTSGDTRGEGAEGGARAVRLRARTFGRAWGRRAARWHVLGDAPCLPRGLKRGPSAVEATEGEKRARDDGS